MQSGNGRSVAARPVRIQQNKKTARAAPDTNGTSAAPVDSRPRVAPVKLTLVLLACQPGNDRETHAETEADSWQHIRDQGRGTLHILYVPSGGFTYTDDDGKLTGAVIEIFRLIKSWAEDNYEVELELAFEPESNWSRFYNRVADAGDGLIGTGNVTITEPPSRSGAVQSSLSG